MLVEAVERAGQDGAARLMQRMEQWREQRAAARAGRDLSVGSASGCEGGLPGVVAGVRNAAPVAGAARVRRGRVRGLMNLVRRFLPADARPGAATAVTSTLVGALQLARALGDNAEGRAVLAEARQALLSRHEPEGERAPH